MVNWLHVSLAIAFTSIFILILLVILQKCFHPKTRPNAVVSDPNRNPNSFQNGISRLHQITSRKASNYYFLQKEFSAESPAFFNWVDHPSLLADAVENGWSRFAFRTLTSSPSVKPVFGPSDVEIGWEVCEGSEDYVQRIRVNQGLRKAITAVDLPTGAISVIRAGLPLPGPRFGNSGFPQQAFFEITILGEDENGQFGDDDNVWVSIGLTGKGPIPLKIPGSFQGSIGFNSTGSVYLNGNKLVFESETNKWKPNTRNVIGCGYNPSQKKIIFTSDSKLVHEIHCKTDEFSHPLYPTLAANTDITVLFNLGQSPFKFGPANSQRTPNPSLIGPGHANSPAALGYYIEDSKELFSMGRIDSQWLQRGDTRHYNTANSVRSLDFDRDSESELFEIVLDGTGRSPHSMAYH
ncbi:protein ssh4 [Striga asiatica]|uniref:Protein ssh4 n=1 Tax=Striga asiatica TaxID=4170 RepID=A0A5A7PBG8_STRAF|nr:protein ssh4 [Striga asiatica]